MPYSRTQSKDDSLDIIIGGEPAYRLRLTDIGEDKSYAMIERKDLKGVEKTVEFSVRTRPVEVAPDVLVALNYKQKQGGRNKIDLVYQAPQDIRFVPVK